MATVTPTETETAGRTYLSHWALLTATTDGIAVQLPGAADRAVQVYGTNWGGATCVIEGSLDGTNYFTLHDAAGSALSFTTSGGNIIQENVLHLRARLSVAGTAAVVDVYVLHRSTK